MTTLKLGEDIKQAILAAGFEWRPYVPRRYFEVNMMAAEHERTILSEWKQFWIGYAGEHEEQLQRQQEASVKVTERMRQARVQAA